MSKIFGIASSMNSILSKIVFKFFSKSLVNKIYQAVLNKSPEKEILNFYGNLVSKNGDIDCFIGEIINSEDFWRKSVAQRAEQLVAETYQGLLGTEPDAAATGFIARIKETGALAPMLSELGGSEALWRKSVDQRAEQLVVETYQSLLGREPDVAAASFIAQVKKTGDLTPMLSELGASEALWRKSVAQRAEQLVTEIYQGLLGTELDAAASDFVARLKETADLTPVLSELGGAEALWRKNIVLRAEQLVAKAYREILGMEPDESAEDLIKCIQSSGDLSSLFSFISSFREAESNFPHIEGDISSISKSMVFHGYQFFLGRPPENEGVYKHWTSSSNNVENFLDTLIRSKEFKENKRLKNVLSVKRLPKNFPRDDGGAGNDNFLIISGCQGEVIEGLISALTDIKPISRIFLKHTDLVDAEELWIDNNIDLINSSKKIIIQRKAVFDKLVRRGFGSENMIYIPLVECTFQHPDMCYLFKNSDGKSILSPMGDYHSLIILLSYFSGLSVSATEALFNHECYVRLGFYDEAKSSLGNMISVASEMGFDISSFIEKWNDSGESWMWSFNHPKKNVIMDLLKFALEKEKISIHDYGLDFVDDPLSKGPCWPVYASPMALKKDQNLFKMPNSFVGGVRFLGLREMIEKSFICYEGLTINDVRACSFYKGIDLKEMSKKLHA